MSDPAAGPLHVTYNANTTELGHTVGSVFLGYIFSMIVYGFNSYQLYMYFSTIFKESTLKKWTIGILGVLDSASLGLMTHVTHSYMIAQFPAFTVPAVAEATNTFCADNLVAVVTVFLVQLAYADRIRKYSNICAAVLSFLATSALGLGIVMTIQLVINPKFNDLKDGAHLTILGTCQAITFVVSASTFAILMFHETPVSGSKSGLAKNIDRMISICVEKGAAAAVLQAGYLIVFFAAPSHRYWIPFMFIARRLFLLSLITLYINDGVRERRYLAYPSSDDSSKPHLKPINFSTLRAASETQTDNTFVEKPGVFNISVTREVLEDSDRYPSK